MMRTPERETPTYYLAPPLGSATDYCANIKITIGLPNTAKIYDFPIFFCHYTEKFDLKFQGKVRPRL